MGRSALILGFVFGIGACGVHVPPAADGLPSSMARVLGAATQDDCPQGGVELEYGIDVNGNGALDDEEVNGSYSVCHGEPGPQGADGASCVTQENEDGSYTILCPGQDDVVLSPGQGPQGEPGLEGPAGSPGVPGMPGVHSLIRNVAIEAGETCPAGGARVESGLDIDESGSLSDEEVMASFVVCHGVPGEAGAAGAPGAPGSPGISVSSANVNALTGDLTFWLSDGSELQLGSVKGPAGAPGSSCSVSQSTGGPTEISCTDGTSASVSSGEDGSSCTVSDAGNGTKIISCDDDSSATVSDGQPGQAGQPGAPAQNSAVVGGGPKAFGAWAFAECPVGKFPISGGGLCVNQKSFTTFCPANWNATMDIFNCNGNNLTATGWGLQCSGGVNGAAYVLCMDKPQASPPEEPNEPAQ